MRFNKTGDLIGGTGSYQGLWLVNGAPSSLGTGTFLGAWLDDDLALTNQTGHGIVAFRRSSGFATAEPFFATPCNALCAGGGNWVATLFVTGRPSFGWVNGGPVPMPFDNHHTITGIDRLGNCLFRDASSHFWALWTDGSVTDCGWAEWAGINDGNVLVLSNPVRLWTQHSSQPCQTVAMADLVWPMPVGDEWISYAAPGHGRVLHRFDDATQGYYLTDGYSPDVLLYEGRRYPAVSSGEAELATQYIRDASIALGVGMVPLVPQPPIPPEPPHPIPPEPPMTKPKTIVLAREGGQGVRCWTVTDDRARIDGRVLLSDAAADPRTHFSVSIFDQPGHKPGMHEAGNKAVWQSAQDQVAAVPNIKPREAIPEGSLLLAALTPCGLWEIQAGTFPNTWQYVAPAEGKGIAMSADGVVTIERLDAMGADLFAFKLYEVTASGLKEIVGPF